MKRLKSYKLFESESSFNSAYDISLIEDMLFDYSDKDISVNISEGSWILTPKFHHRNVEYITHLDAMKTAIYEDEKLRFLIEAAKIKISAWQTMEKANANV